MGSIKEIYSNSEILKLLGKFLQAVVSGAWARVLFKMCPICFMLKIFGLHLYVTVFFVYIFSLFMYFVLEMLAVFFRFCLGNVHLISFLMGPF